METVVRNPAGAPVLFWLDGALGDTLLAYPALAALRLSAAGWPLVAVGNPAYYAFAARLGLIDRIYATSGAAGTALFGGTLPPNLPLPDTAVLFSGAQLALAERFRALGVARVIAAPARGPGTRHQSTYLLDCLRPLLAPDASRPPVDEGAGASPDAVGRKAGRLDSHPQTPHAGFGQVVWSPAEPLAPAPRPLLGRIGRIGQPTVLLHPGTGGRWKRWPLRHFQRLAGPLARAGLAVRWSCGPADDDLREALLATSERPGELWPDLNLDDYAALLARCTLLVSADTGVAHLASLLSVPQVALFGPTDPRRWTPLGGQAAVIQSPDLCGGRWEALPAALDEPASEPRLALQRCHPTDRFACRCLAALPVEEVLAACLAALQ